MKRNSQLMVIAWACLLPSPVSAASASISGLVKGSSAANVALPKVNSFPVLCAKRPNCSGFEPKRYDCPECE